MSSTTATADRRIQFSKPEFAELLTDTPDPKPLGPREVTGRTLCTLISAGTELNVYKGLYETQNVGWGKLPFTPGYSAVFRIDAVGSDVSDLKPGQLCFCMGQHRSRQRVQREDAIPLPAGLEPTKALFARMMGVTMTTLTTTTARPGDLTIVTGLGAIGLLGALALQRCGYRVIGCDPHAGRQAIAKAAGLQQVAPSIPLDDPGVRTQAALVMECSGHEAAVRDACNAVKKRGEVVLVGVPMVRKTEIYAQEIFNIIFRNHVILRSGREWELPRQPTELRPGSMFGNMATALQWLAEGGVRVDGFTETRQPTDPQATYQDLLHNRCDKLAIALDWQ